jgi:Tfp pilus assembly protein PilV
MLRNRRAFTLLEVLIAGGVLFVVSAAVVGLSNSIVQGTTASNDKTITNRWASEGLEIVSKIRDDQTRQSVASSGQVEWFSPALKAPSGPDSYGWYTLAPDPISTWKLVRVNELPAVIDLETSFDTTKAEQKTSDNLEGYRLICVESYGAQSIDKDGFISCNAHSDGVRTVADGDRAIHPGVECYNAPASASVQNQDLYCQLTKKSLNTVTSPGGVATFIPDGNAVKVRALVMWNDRGDYKISDIATVLTNWKSLATQL